MKTKSTIICSLLLALYVPLFYACEGSPSSPEIEKRATIDISVDPDPILMHWNPDLNYGNFSCVVTITEKNGVGVNISKIAFGFSWEQRVWGEWVLFEGRLDPFATKTLAAGGNVIREVDEVRVTIKGKDDNGNEVERIATFAVVWD